MPSRLASALLVAVLLVSTTSVKGKDKKKPMLSPYILQARTALVVIDPDAGEPVDKPMANADARTAVEKALIEWGRFDLLSQGQETDLIIVVRTGNGKMMQPTIKGGPLIKGRSARNLPTAPSTSGLSRVNRRRSMVVRPFPTPTEARI